MFRRQLVIRFLMFISIAFSIYFFYWTVFWEMLYWHKSLVNAIIDSWWNWLLFFAFLGLTAYLSVVGEKPAEFVKTVPEITSIREKPTETISTTKVGTYKPTTVIKCPKCKQHVIEEKLIKIINHAKGTIEYVTPCCQEVVKEIKVIE